MPTKWNAKDERQYQHIKASAEERGKGAKRASEIAARTVNKQRREEGRTPRKTSQGTGNTRSSLAERSNKELYNRARQLHKGGRSSTNKDQLISANRSRQ